MTHIFADPAAARRWQAYFSEVDRLLSKAGDDAGGLRADLEMHVLDSLAAESSNGTELERLNAALARLGRPADYLHPLIADALLERGTRTYAPGPIARGLAHALLAGSKHAATAAVFALGYALLAAFTAMILLKPVWGDHVGLFRRGDRLLGFGIVADTHGARELLGFWIIPIALAVVAALYVALTRALRAARAPR
jgi:hypothetical protein